MKDLDDRILREQTGWGASDSLEYYRSHRTKPEDLYKSERFFLPELLPRIDSVLDVGCAAGGFSRIMKSFNDELAYTGVDITPELIDAARHDHPGSRFEISDGVNIPFAPESFDLVHCSGVLHINSQYKEMVRSMWAQTRRFLLCDFRLTREASQTGTIEIRFKESVAASSVPYFVLNVDDLIEFLKTLSPSPILIRAKGYSHAVSETASVPLERVIMAFFMLEKGANEQIKLEINLSD